MADVELGRGPRFLPDSKLDTKAVASFLNKSDRTIKRWRAKGYGPPYHRVNEDLGQPSIIYIFRDVEAWLKRHQVVPGVK